MRWFMNLPIEVLLYLKKGKTVYTHTNMKIPSSYLLALRHGLHFIPTPKNASIKNIDHEISKLERRILISRAMKEKIIDTKEKTSNIHHPSEVTNERLREIWKIPITRPEKEFLHELKEFMKKGRNGDRNYNLSKEDRMTLKEIQNDPELLICGTDKNLGPILVSKSIYKKELLSKHLVAPTFRLLRNEQSAKSFLGTYAKQIKELARKIYPEKEDEPEDKEFKFLLFRVKLKESIFPIPYLLWKVHKNPIASRCIIPSHKYYTSNAALWLHEKLLPLLEFCETVLPDSNSLIKILDKFKGRKGMTIASKDVTALYPNIPIKQGVEAMERTINEFLNSNVENDKKSLLRASMQKSTQTC